MVRSARFRARPIPRIRRLKAPKRPFYADEIDELFDDDDDYEIVPCVCGEKT